MMGDPFRKLKMLPWLRLLHVAALTIFVTIALSFVLAIASFRLPLVGQALTILFSSPLVLLPNMGVGALAVVLLERVWPQVRINAASLWALVLCVMVVSAVVSFSPVSLGWIGLDQLSLVGVMLGIFFQGRRYWR